MNLRTALDASGYGSVKIVARRLRAGAPPTSRSATRRSRNAVDVVRRALRRAGTAAPRPTARSSGQRREHRQAAVGQRERVATTTTPARKPLARGINRGYIDGKMTALHQLAADRRHHPEPAVGDRSASRWPPQPWSGYYSVGKNAWVMAHTTQFTAPGWRYLDSASGYLGGNRNNGSYVTLQVAEQHATTARSSRRWTPPPRRRSTSPSPAGCPPAPCTSGPPTSRSNNPADYFVRGARHHPVRRRRSRSPCSPATSTRSPPRPGRARAPRPAPRRASLALPYSDNFDSYAVGREAKYLTDMQGSFEIAACAAGRPGGACGRCRAQAPITWTSQLADPYTLLGDLSWHNYTVSLRRLLEKAGYVELHRPRRHATTDPTPAESERVLPAGHRHRGLVDPAATTPRQLAHAGQRHRRRRWAPDAGTPWRWRSTAAPSPPPIDGATVGTVNDSTFGAGLVGYRHRARA